MQIFMEFIDRGIWDAILNEPYLPIIIVNNMQEPKPYPYWTAKENKKISI